MTKQQIVFFGSGPVAAKSLALLARNFEIEAVVTKPTTFHEMKTSAGAATIHTVSNRKELDDLIASDPFQSKLAVLIDFGIIVSKSVIEYFPLGIINSHFSILPEWRGADPITFALLSGQPSTGVSLMLLDEGMNTGKILKTKSLKIDAKDTSQTLTDKLIHLSDDMLAESVPQYIAGDIQPRSQSHPDRATYSRKLTKEDGIIDWSRPAEQIEREIRAFKDWPKSLTVLGGKEVIITAAHTINEDGTPGMVEVRSKELCIFTGKGALVIDQLKPAGKKEMPAQAFLAGYGHLLS